MASAPHHRRGSSAIPASAFGDSVNVTITGMTRSGTTVTATTSGAHGFTAGNSVTISNSPETAYNGTKTLLTASGTTFTFASTVSVRPSADNRTNVPPPARWSSAGATARR